MMRKKAALLARTTDSMKFFSKFLQAIHWPVGPRADFPALQQAFREQYKNFRSLLTANNNALELMAEMEQAADQGRPFGMTFVRTRCTALSVNVYKMIQRLRELSGGKYERLLPAFKEVSEQMEAILSKQPAVAEGPFILELAEIDRHAADQVGEKMANLGEIRNRAGCQVPDGFVITAAASQHFLGSEQLRNEINRRLTLCDPDNLEELYTTSAAIQQLIAEAVLPEDLDFEIHRHYQGMAAARNGELLVAMRSSALGEDSGNISFAGQYRTQLQVSEEFLSRTYKEILASKYKSQAIVYRMQRGFRSQDVIMCVGCLAMVDAVVSGVMYSRSPTDPRSSWVLITAVAGLASQVVDGRAATDVLRVARAAPHAIVARELRQPEGAARLTDEQAGELTRLAVRLEAHFGTPQDIEWSIEPRGRIIVLQSRPLGQATTPEKLVGGEVMTGSATPFLLAGGVMASRGAAAGPAHLVNSSLDLLQFPKGAVLVVAHPLPEWATLMPRAVAVVSETGQVAAHLATVAREFRVPAIFGMAGATQKIMSGQLITVDATGCRVYDGRQDEILADSAPLPNLMEGSPVHRLLKEVLRLATPLHLTDPASLYFKPSSCTTFHDLTRFCHEKAVSEMFAFGAKHGFDAKSAKQLVGETPFQWWVINLDDGFSDDFVQKEKFVQIGQIVSVPMLAIWAGMTAIPWQGPPPVSLSGFGSILFHSTMNRELDPAVRSGLANRNYFMVSKNFCNLSVRLGYHFSLVEAHLDDLLTENYVSFQFKGGAADDNRRLLRVTLLRDILERYDFRVETVADALTARIEKKPASYLAERLKIIGHLLIHTRQIDMVMADPAMVEHYRNKILADLATIVPQAEHAHDEPDPHPAG